MLGKKPGNVNVQGVQPQGQNVPPQGFPQGQQPMSNQQAMPQGNPQMMGQQSMQQAMSNPQMAQGNPQMMGQQPNMQVQRPMQGQQPIQQRPVQGQPSMQAQRPIQGQPNMQQRPAQGQQPMQNGQQVSMNGQQLPPNGQQIPPQKPKKKFNPLMVVIPLVLLVVVALVFVFVFKGKKEPEQVAAQQDYNISGKYALDQLMNGLLTYDAVAIDAIVGVEDGDSWLAQEWAYVNNVKLRQEFLKKVGGMTTFTYPMVPQVDVNGVTMTDGEGSPIMIESYMNANEAFTVTVPDYAVLSSTIAEEKDYITSMYKTYLDTAEHTYRMPDDMFNLLMQYLCDKPTLPTKEVQIQLEIRLNVNGTPYIVDDAPLDDALFGNEDFRNMCEVFSQTAKGWTGFKDEHYTEKEEQHNEEWDRWHAQFIAYYEADGGHYDPETHTYSGGKFDKRRSKWEPWYLRDENNVIQKDENGEQIVNYFSIKDEQGNDWIQPDETILVDVDKVRQVEDPWVNESGIRYNNLGTHYITTVYNGAGLKVFRVGDGSFEHPAGIGTTVITKALGDDGKYHDVEVAVIGYWVGQDAIDYAELFSQRNRGFTVTSVVQLITYELTIKNLETEPITINSEMTLCDRNANVSARTGTMYDFLDQNITLKPGETKTVNDWASSTELQQKYVCWGKSFGRQYPTMYFSILAGTGQIPSYSAYHEFTGNSVIESEQQ